MRVSSRGVQLVYKGEVQPRETKGRAAKSLRMAQRSQSCRGITAFLGARNRINEVEVEQRGDSPVLVMHDGVIKSIFAHSEEVDFLSCEKVVVKMIIKDSHNLGYHRVVFRCDNEPSILALLRAVKLAWTGDVVQGTSAEGGPQSNGAAERSGACPIKLAVMSATGVEVPAGP